MEKRSIMLFVLCSIFLFGCGRVNAPPPTPTPTLQPTPILETRLTDAERLAIFDAVWQAVNEKYFDPTFGGKDWQAIGVEYRQKLANVDNDVAFWFGVLNPMLFELGVSHLAALPAELANELDHITFATGSLGLDIRQLGENAVITRVMQGSPAAQAGLRPGFVITAMDGRTLSDFAALSMQTPPENERNQRGNVIQSMRSALYGEAGKQVVIEYLDATDQPISTTLQFSPRSNSTCGQLDPSLPPACAEIEVKRLDNGIGYLRFSGFLMPVLDSVLRAIDNLGEAPVIIIDLRGNPGGVFPVRKAIASQLVGEPKLFMRYQHRDWLEEAYLDPVSGPYTGEVVILVDELTASSSEEFSGSLQALGRATIVGKQTPGRCLTMNIETLPNDAMLVYPYGQSQTPDGRILEGNGVVPDIEVSLDRVELLQGIDAQLEAAIQYATEKP